MRDAASSPAEHRNALLAAMTDEVARLVLRDNYEQNVLLGNARVQAPALLPVHRRLISSLESRGELDRGAGVPPDAGRDRAAARPPVSA